MKSPPISSEGATPLHSGADLGIPDQLKRRPSRACDYAAENEILGVLADELAERPDNLLQKLADLLVENGIGDSAGISLRETVDGRDELRWVALAGDWGPFKGGTTPFDASPCGIVIRQDAVLLLDHPERYFPQAAVDPLIHEILLVPFYSAGQPVGTLWVTMHSDTQTFEAEDVRLLRSLARFAAASRRVADALSKARAEERVSRAALSADIAGLHRLHELHAKLASETDLGAALRDILAAAVDLTGTDRGVLQRVSEDGERLEFAAHQGYGEGTAFTEHFRFEGAKAVCDAVRAHVRRIVVEDIATFPGLAGTVDREIALAEDIRATLSTPMISRTGEMIGVLNTQFRQPYRPSDRELRLMDMLAWTAAGFIERHSAADTALRESETRFRELGEASSDVIWIRDAWTLDMEYLSPAFATVYGAPCEPYVGTGPTKWLSLIHPEDREAFMANLDRLRAGERVRHEFRIVRPLDNEVRWIRNTDFPLTDDKGRITRIGGIGHDATEEVELQDRLRVLVAELQHRTRNLMGVVRSVTDKTLVSSTSLADFQGRIRDRLNALARVNSLLSRLNGGHRITFDELLRTELMAHGVADPGTSSSQVAMDGPQGIRLRSSTVQTLALGLHELATNALKHGALSRPEGRLEVNWALVNGQTGDKRLRVDWHENGVPVATANQDHGPGGGAPARPRRGYGRELIERALPYQLKAETHYELTPEGVRCTITLPVSSTMNETDSAPEEPDA